MMYLSKLEASCLASETLPELKSVFLRYLEPFNTDYFTQFTLGEGGAMKPSGPFGCFDHPWPAHYVRRNFLWQDAALVTAFRATRPILWSEAYAGTPRKISQILEEARAFGLSDGLVVPIRAPMGEVTIFTVAGDQFAPSREQQGVLQLAAQIAYERFCQLDEGWQVENDRLTPAQNKVLSLAAQGLDGPSIASTLGISPQTVKDHKKDIFRRLGVPDIAHAIFEGYRCGLIHTPR